MKLSILEELNKYGGKAVVTGMGIGERAMTAALAVPLLYVAPDLDTAVKVLSQVEALGRQGDILAQKFTLVFGMDENKNPTFKKYFEVLNKLTAGELDILIVLPEVLMQRLPCPQFFRQSCLSLSVGDKYDLDIFISKLSALGFVRTDIISTFGEFSVRGDILDVYLKAPTRISFFDCLIESVTEFDAVSFKMTNKLDGVDIAPVSFVVIDDKQKLIENITKSLGNTNLEGEKQLRLNDIVFCQTQALSGSGIPLSNIFVLPFQEYFNSSIMDYFKDFKVFLDESKIITDKLRGEYEEIKQSFEVLISGGEILEEHKKLYLTHEEILESLKTLEVTEFRKLGTKPLFENTKQINFEPMLIGKFAGRFDELVFEIRSWLRLDFKIFLSCGMSLTQSKIKNLLDSAGLKYRQVDSLDECGSGINVSEVNIPLSAGFSADKFVLVGSDALNAFSIVKPGSKKALGGYQPRVGEFVVHTVHGIGKCIGIEKLKLTQSFRDYIVIEYLGGDILYLPSENVDLISAYVGEPNPRCNKIGGAEFFKVKQRVKASVKEMAFDLLEIYSKRERAQGYRYPEDTYLQAEFERAFPYAYTEDQILALRDIKNDMMGGRVVERLICGDVGFGKTEVALAAAYKVIQQNKQVAIICPTTILSEQHFNTCQERLKPFMAEAAVLNRFKTPSEQQQVLRDLKSGKVNIVCGTHRLLSADVKFKDLGLLILDEEQRLGVEHKEKLKHLKHDVDVLTLSATPIPRTLYMSLVGIRDISYINTPPIDRLAPETHVVEYSETLIKEVCVREVTRGGQVLIVYNRVESIDSFTSKIKALLPGVSVGVAHGQMKPKQLEESIYKLFSRQTQVLVSTVLIENGIDLPLANTLIVVDADMLGLSQLYQLKGRIGRSNRSSYAYFTFKKDKALSKEGYGRLSALMEFSGMGNGYKIALRDLEIRGAGDILGARQHGHMERVGYDLYVKLLAEAVSEIKGEAVTQKREIKIDIPINAYLPSEFALSSERRIAIYTQISRVKTSDMARIITEQLQNTYGRLPGEVLQLINIALIKNLGENIGVKHIKIEKGGAKIDFYEDIAPNILQKLSQYQGFEQSVRPSIKISATVSAAEVQNKVVELLEKLNNN
ncbi:MAG: transcription-repair coupling factor [Christensenellaceae bacterium]|jgi:transcription-repair coupling factor (superfamily II helicase)|nr:transcription-repair coupling factor [Christensenellaceae bacterium]